MPLFTHEIQLATPIQTAFEFLTRPENLTKISPPSVGLRFLDAPEAYTQGDEVHFAVQNFGMVQKIRHRITEMTAPDRFVEELIEGPVPTWIHIHEFYEISDSETKIVDHIEFEPPSGIVGMMLNENRIVEHLEDALHYREQQLIKHLL